MGEHRLGTEGLALVRELYSFFLLQSYESQKPGCRLRSAEKLTISQGQRQGVRTLSRVNVNPAQRSRSELSYPGTVDLGYSSDKLSHMKGFKIA